jgi:hypothetical protein
MEVVEIKGTATIMMNATLFGEDFRRYPLSIEAGKQTRWHMNRWHMN